METAVEEFNTEMQKCLKECLLCYKSCSDTLVYCLNMGGKHADPAHIKLLMDCAEICRTSADFMLRNSEFSGKICQICAAVCEACADDCEKFDDAHMSQSAQVCRNAAASCMEMG